MRRQLPRTSAAAPLAVPPVGRDLSRHRPQLVLGWLAAAGVLTVSGCGFAVDTPLHVTDVARAVAPGHQIVGKVGYPDGKISVTLAPEASSHETGHRTLGETPCKYKKFRHTFTCSTADRVEGLYVVQVTDAGQPGEGTAQAQVAITDVAGYDPHMVVGDGNDRAEAGPVDLKLWGWRPGGAVRITFVDANNKALFTRSAVPDARGAVTLTTIPLTAGYYNIVATDGLWKINGSEGSDNDAYSGLQVS